MEKGEFDLFLWAHDADLSFIIAFHNELKRLMRNEIVSLNEKIGLDGNDNLDQKKLTRDIYINTLEPSLHSATFLMMFSHFEEWLFLLKSICAKQINLDSKAGSIGRFKPILKDGLGIDLSRCKAWQQLLTAEKVRNCLLHANGRVDLAKNEAEIRKVVSNSKMLLSIKSRRLLISSGYVDIISESIFDFIKQVRIDHAVYQKTEL